MNDTDRFKHWDKLSARRALQERVHEAAKNQPPRTSEEAYAQMDRNRALEKAEKLKTTPADLPYITP